MAIYHFKDEDSGQVLTFMGDIYLMPNRIRNPFSDKPMVQVARPPSLTPMVRYYCHIDYIDVLVYETETFLTQCPICGGTVDFINITEAQRTQFLTDLSANDTSMEVGRIKVD